MRILHFWKTDHLYGGGGGIAMYRLHKKLREHGIDSNILCKRKTSSSTYSTSYRIPRYLVRIENAIKRITIPLGMNDIHAIGSFKLKENSNFKSSDIIHFHGIHGNFFSYLALPYLTREKPAVFTLHDMWSFTGHCAYSYDCVRWKTGCGKCPYPNNLPPIKKDKTHLEWLIKKRIYNHSRLSIVSLSTVQMNQAKNSILNCFPIHFIPNGVDINEYSPLDKEKCRYLLDIPNSKNVLLFAALDLKQHNKGGDLLFKAINSLPKSMTSNLLLLILGGSGERLKLSNDIQTINLGFLQNERLKAVAFSAADIFVTPTRAESFGLVALESMACGTPVVAFGVGGILDLVKHRDTGYVAEPENAMDLRKGIEQLLSDPNKIDNMGKKSREIAVKKYSIERQIKKHIDLYREILA